MTCSVTLYIVNARDDRARFFISQAHHELLPGRLHDSAGMDWELLSETARRGRCEMSADSGVRARRPATGGDTRSEMLCRPLTRRGIGFVTIDVAHASFLRVSSAPMATGGAVHEERPLYQPKRDLIKTIACSVQKG